MKESTCKVSSTVHATAPSEPNVSPLIGEWYMNADHTIWAMHYDHWLGGVANKVPWIRPAGVRLLISGWRLDGPSPPLKVKVAGVLLDRFSSERD